MWQPSIYRKSERERDRQRKRTEHVLDARAMANKSKLSFQRIKNCCTQIQISGRRERE